MTGLISELHQTHAANENSYTPAWMSEVPDDWSHTIAVTSDQPVLNHRYSANDESDGSDAVSEANNAKAA